MTISRMTFDIDKELKTELQIIALRQDRAVKDILNDLIQDFVNKNK
jgi:predicted transcriptional regulator